MTYFYDEKMECISRKELEKIQLELFNKQLARAKQTKFYQGKLPDKISDLSEIQNIHLTTKDDLKKNGTFDFLAIPVNEIARTCATSGTTGKPLLIFYSKSDLKNFAVSKARHYCCSGLESGKSIQCMMNLNLSVSNLCHLACEEVSANFIPAGVGNSIKQLDVLESLGTEVCFATPNYLMHLCDLAKKEGRKITLKKAIVFGEPCSPALREKIMTEFGIEMYDNYGSTEMTGGVAAECHLHNGLHLEEDYYYVEIIDPETKKPLPDGEYGELVITPLTQEAMPFIRYCTHDITRIIPEPCPCGRTHRRIEPITHRIDDMMLINGTNVFPSQIEECIYKYLSAATNYLIHVTEKDNIKKLVIDIELPDEILNDKTAVKNLEEDLIQTMVSRIVVTPRLNFIPKGTLPEIQGKVKRVVVDKN